MRVSPIWFIAGTASLCVVSALTWLTYTTEAPAMVEPPAEDGGSSWCAEGLELVGDGCFAAPTDSSNGPVTMLVYLHGRYAPDSVREELDRQGRVAKRATAKGFAVLALRGTKGECNSPEYKDYWCWPSNERNASDGPAFVARWEAPIAAARERLGPGPNVLLGFSNGGYFAALIAKRALARFDAVVVAHGGPIAVESVRDEPEPPMLLITADDDASDPEMTRLDDELTRTRWPHALVAREGGHALPDWDIDSALTFFKRIERERLPLSPPLESRSTRRRAPAPNSVSEAGVEVTVDRADDLGDL